MTTRRNFIATSLGSIAAASIPSTLMAESTAAAPLFEISLAEWSLHRTIFSGKLNNLEFPKYAKKTCGINAVEYVNAFFFDKAKDEKYLTELKTITAGEGVANVLIMIDREGDLGAKTSADIDKTVENHKKWVEAAKFLGCHSIRVNAGGPGEREELAKHVVEGLTKLSTFAKDFNINVIVENHGGLSSDGAWLSAVLKTVNMPNCGSLPDFGNFHQYDRYQGIKDLMPYAKGVSAKSREFNEAGAEVQTDYLKAMKLVLDAGYRGHVGIEWEGGNISEQDGIMKTKALLEKVRTELSGKY